MKNWIEKAETNELFHDKEIYLTRGDDNERIFNDGRCHNNELIFSVYGNSMIETNNYVEERILSYNKRSNITF